MQLFLFQLLMALTKTKDKKSINKNTAFIAKLLPFIYLQDEEA
jgi:hypothetical protein